MADGPETIEIGGLRFPLILDPEMPEGMVRILGPRMAMALYEGKFYRWTPADPVWRVVEDDDKEEKVRR